VYASETASASKLSTPAMSRQNINRDMAAHLDPECVASRKLHESKLCNFENPSRSLESVSMNTHKDDGNGNGNPAAEPVDAPSIEALACKRD
jgi:hypothetical protein